MERLEHSVGEHHGFGRTLRLGIQYDEFIARDTTDHAVAGQHHAQTFGDCDQDVVTGGMPETVVDVLESVDVDEEHRRLPVVAPCRAQCGLDVLQH